MNSLKKFYLDFIFVFGTIWLFSILTVMFAQLHYGLREFLIIIGISLVYAIIKLFWDNYNLERITDLENEVKQLKEELAKKNN